MISLRFSLFEITYYEKNINVNKKITFKEIKYKQIHRWKEKNVTKKVYIKKQNR